MPLKRLVFLVFLFLASAPALAVAGENALAAVPDAAIVGRGVLSYAFWDIYQATLYAPQGHWDPAKPFALSIEYFHRISGKDIADRAVEEMRRQGFTDEVKLAAWNAQMKGIFPDVGNGSILSAIYMPGEKTVFYNGDEVIGTINGDAFGRSFFAIWLGEKTSEPNLRRALLGLS